MPNRILSGEITRSDSLSRVSRDAGFMFVMLIASVDDFGRFDGRPRALLAALFPMREDVSLEQLDGWLREFEREGMVHRYDVDGRPYLELPTWGKYQRFRDSKPKFPPPGGWPPEAANGEGQATTSGDSPQVAADRGSRARAPNPNPQTQTQTQTQTEGDAARAAPAPEPLLSGETRGDPARWVSLLSKMAGTKDQKLAFVQEHLAQIELEAITELKPDRRDSKAVNAKIASLLIRYWRQALKGPAPAGRRGGRVPGLAIMTHEAELV